MKRRNAIKMISLGMGYTISASALATLVSACKPEPTIDWQPQFFKPKQGAALEKLLEVMLPATDTPGAKDVGLAQLIDLLIQDVFEIEDQEKFRKGMAIFFKQFGNKADIAKINEEVLSEGLTTAFAAMKSDAGKALMNKKEDEVTAEEKDKYKQYNFLKTLNRMAISGYFSSEVVATEHLNYDPVPGPYQGCIPVEDVGNNWAL